MLGVHVTKRPGQQLFDGLADELPGRPAEHRLERTIGRHDRAAGIHRHDALRGGLQQKP